MGVTRGFAGVKLSGSIKENGACMLRKIKRNMIATRLVASLRA